MADLTTRIVRRPPTLAHMFWDRSQTSPDAVAFSYPVNGGWQESTWAQTRELVEPLAAGLISLGIEPEDRVAIISETRFEWILADLAIMCAGGATTTLHPSTGAAEMAHILNDADVTIIFAESLEQVAKLRQIRADIRKVRKVVLFDLDHRDERVMTLEELLSVGEAVLTDDPSAVTTRLATLRPDMLATICYPTGTVGTTSGTGRARGVCHSHAAWTFQGAAIAAEEILGPEDLQLLWLPLSHPSGKLLLTAQLACGFATAVDGDAERIFDNLALTQPTFMAAAPGFVATARTRILAMQDLPGGVESGVSDQTYTKVRESFGSRLRLLITWGAALDPDTVECLKLAGIAILESYGWAEAAAGTFVNRPDQDTLGFFGHAFAGAEVRIAKDGEVLVRGPGVMLGYHKLPDETASVLRDGWLSTGDIGEFDEVGRLRISGRKADRVKTAHGN